MKKMYKIKFSDKKYNRPTDGRKEKVQKVVLAFNDYLLECIGEDAGIIDSAYISIIIDTKKKPELEQ